MTAMTDASAGAVSGDLPLPKGCQKSFSLERLFETGLVSHRGALQESHSPEGDAASPGLTLAVVLALSKGSFGAGACAVPSPEPTACPFNLSSNHRAMQEAGETSSCRKPGSVCSAHSTPHPAPQNPTAHSLPGCNDTFQQDEVSPIGSSQITVVFGGSL